MKKKKKEKKRWIKNKTLRVSIKIFLITFLAVCCICAGLLLGVVAGCILTTQPLTDIDLKISDLTSTIYDSKGNVIQTFTGTDYSNSEWANYDEVPKNLIKGLIDIEDERFYKHSGIDIKRTIGAGLSFFIPGMGNYGGSTITQQVVKNVTGDDARSVPRKIREQWRAIQLERTHSKEEILEIYVNVIAMGHNMTGVKIAAKAYFNKDLSELSLAECALLAGITNNPSKYDPFTTTGRANAIKRQELILKKMLDLGDITEDDYNAALKEELHF
ncbi:MAG: transglycosylase domain-containing protein, partial [Clostridiales bacterium]|nr:transglycosylase domain-containing protein [Clostridiales bacterium]